LACAVAIKLEDGGPIFHVQERWGKGKKPITVYKFRSMVVEPESTGGSVQAKSGDPRITGVGRFLRATSLDELPQLLNIWRGEMSWVGPRALPINEVQLNADDNAPDEVIPGFDERCRVKPGLTGIAQVYAPRDVPRRQKFRYDRLYIRHQSFWLDFKVIVLSFWITFRGRWEHRGGKL
jgi:lipopolysaccharide/colanic/teichoic acid biosynthesis glycosyltransferase